MDYASGYRLQKLVAVVFIGCLVILFLSGFDTVKAKARDVKRRADVKVLVRALDLYHDKYGKYPDSINDWRGWDLSLAYGDQRLEFLSALNKERLMDRAVKDPVNDAANHYRYGKFQAGDYGCANSFYILQVVNFELPTSDNGQGACPELDWAALTPNGYTVQAAD
ncbi:MAG: hypothetical protein Q8O93_00980 [bacterium]|nr:hypothetical protein [bacterium]